MAKVPQIGEDTKITLDFKTIGMIVGFVITLSGMWYTLQADIAEAMVKPEPVIDRVEYDLKNDQTHPTCLLYTSPSPRDRTRSRMPSSA